MDNDGRIIKIPPKRGAFSHGILNQVRDMRDFIILYQNPEKSQEENLNKIVALKVAHSFRVGGGTTEAGQLLLIGGVVPPPLNKSGRGFRGQSPLINLKEYNKTDNLCKRLSRGYVL